MKTTLTSLILALTATLALGHGAIEIGPNKGRILEFSTDETMHGEVTAKDGKLHIAVLDKDMKPVTMATQALTATAGERGKPVKLEVIRNDKGFIVTAPKDGEWLILQYKENESTKPVTARLHYDTKQCATCVHPEWLCSCGEQK